MQRIRLSDIREKGLLRTLGQFIKFSLVGVSNTLISMAVYYLFIWLDRDLYIVGQIAGFFLSVLNAYYWNNRYVFRGGQFWDAKKLLKTYLAYGGTSLLSLGLSVLEVELWHVSEWLVPVINLCITVPVNFLTHKLWVYRKKPDTGEKTALVTGATGMLGAATVQALLNDGYAVTALVRPGTDKLDRLPKSPQLTVLEAALADIPSADLPRCRLWFHFAWGATAPAERNDDDAQRRNVAASLAALNRAAALGCERFVFAGSQAEYGVCQGPIAEDTPCAPRSAYGRAKLAFGLSGAKQAAAYGLEFVHLRIFSVYGEGDQPGTLVSGCLRAFLAGADMALGPAAQRWNYLYVGDFARLMVAIADAKRAGGVYNVAGCDTRPLRDFIEEIHALCGGRGRCLYGDRPPRPEGEVQLDPVIERVCTTFRWQPETPFARGIETMIAKERERLEI